MAHNNNNNRPKKPRPSKKDSAQPAIVCSAHVVRLLEPSSPNSSVAHPIYLHDILVEQDKQERVTEEYPYSTVYDNAASRHYMQIHDNFVTLQFDVITNLDQSTAATVPVYLSVVHDHPFEEDLIPFARLVTVDLAAPQQKLWRALYQQTILPGLVHSFQVHPGSVGDGLYSQWHDMCRTIVTAKLATLATVGETHVLLVTTTDCGINITIYPENYHQQIFHLVTGDNYYYVTTRYTSIFTQAAAASTSTSATVQANLMHSPDPSIATIGDPSNLYNYLPDSGATRHMTPRLADLQDVVGGQKLGVEVADGHVIKCSSTGTICIAMQKTMAATFKRLFTLTKFAKHGHHALVKNNANILYLGSAGNSGHPVTVMTGNIHCTVASDITVQQDTYNPVPSA
jgi:hypothetical protein